MEALETIDLASELMIPTEEKTAPKKETPAEEPASPTPSAGGSSVSTPGSVAPAGNDDGKVPITEVISADDSAEYFVSGIDAIIGILGTSIYSIRAARILNKEQKAIVAEAVKTPEEDRTPEAKQLILYLEKQKEKFNQKVEKLDLTDPEQAKLKKASKGMIKTKGWKIGPDFAFWIIMADILADRAIDMFMD